MGAKLNFRQDAHVYICKTRTRNRLEDQLILPGHTYTFRIRHNTGPDVLNANNNFLYFKTTIYVTFLFVISHMPRNNLLSAKVYG
jgi:hypothetical protein